MEGWIKLHRRIQRSQLYRSLTSKQRDVMMQCLLMANHQSSEWEWGANLHKCDEGQFISSLDSIAGNCGKDVKVQSVRTALLKLEKWGFLTNESTKTGRLITICHWHTYQSEEKSTNKDQNRQPTKIQQRSNKELTTNKNVNKGKNDKKDTTIAWSSSGGWSNHEEHIERWIKTYPACDVNRQLLEMHDWLIANPLKAKKSNWARFITNWLKRAQDRGGDLVRSKPATTTPKTTFLFDD